MAKEKVLIIDTTGAYQQLIARQIRELNIYSEVKKADTAAKDLKKEGYLAVLLAGEEHEKLEEAANELERLEIPLLKMHIQKEENLSITDPVVQTEKENLYTVEFPSRDEFLAHGKVLFSHFLYTLCGLQKSWNLEDFANEQIEAIKKEVGDRHVLCALSGGVDSSVAAVLVHRAIGKQLTCIFVDHGLLRKGEAESVEQIFRDQFDMELIKVDARERFLDLLKDVTEPEKKRKIIGETFIRVFEDEAKKIDNVDFLVQGTIYPDIIESGIGGEVVKSHHNVGGLPEDIGFEGLIEPLKDLFKNEVREVGLVLGIPEDLVFRQPFPGPGLAVRCLGEVREDKLAILREADAIFREEIKNAGLDRNINQYFAVLTDMRSVGVKKGARTYDYTIGLRAVTTSDFMTATWARIPLEVLEICSGRITAEVEQVNRVVYDITSKPPATIEWE